MTAPLSYNERERFALRLYAAFLDVSEERLPELFKSRFSDSTIAQWCRVAEVALGLRTLRSEAEEARIGRAERELAEAAKARRDATPCVADKPASPSRKARTTPPASIARNEPVWCGQCEQRVAPTKAEACGSRFCKAKVAR